MFHRQKENILALLKAQKETQNYGTRYWFSYKDFLDPTDDFTSFSCENLDGKRDYIALIENLLGADETARVFVEVYGFEEIGNEPFIYADTLIVFSRLSLGKIKQIFHEPKDIFPSDIGVVTDFSQPEFLMAENGDLIPVETLFHSGDSIFYCWWD